MNTSYLKGKAEHYEIYHTKTRDLSAEISKGKTDFATEGETEGIAVTVTRDGKTGFAYGNEAKDFKKTANKALSIARANDKDKHFKKFVTPQKTKKIKNHQGLTNYTLKDFAKFKTRFLRDVRTVHRKIILSEAYYNKSIEKIKIINSEGLDLEQTSALNTYTYSLVLKHKGELLSAWGLKEGLKPLDPSFAKEEAKRVIALRGRKTVSTTNCPAVFYPGTIAALFSKSFIPNINAENIQQKKSIFTDKINKRIISKELTIIDDAVTKGMTATSSFDHEGTPSQKNIVIDKGLLKTFLYNNYTARKEGRKSTGNAVRTPATMPIVGSNNTIIEAGKEKQLLTDIKKGVYVRDVLGVHTMNALTGDFSLGLLEGFYIENGKIKHPLKNAMIAGNLYEMLNQVTGIGNKTIHTIGANYMPEIRFANIKLIGKS